MKHFFLVITLALAACFAASAQDIITTTGGDRIKAKVVEVGPDFVTYKRIDNPNGPLYKTKISDIGSILYENGNLERFNSPGPAAGYAPERKSVYDVKYRDISGMYDPRYYVSTAGDPYIPALSGMASFFLPGLGQCIDGEWGRGLGIFAANVGFGLLEVTELSALALSGLDYISGYYNNYPYYNGNYYYGYSDPFASFWGGALVVTALTQLAVNIWNICDAVRIAEVKNMYYQDSNGSLASVKLQLEPHLALAPAAGTGFRPAPGLSLKVSF